jgi:hypothetical protein
VSKVVSEHVSMVATVLAGTVSWYLRVQKRRRAGNVSKESSQRERDKRGER